MSQDSKNHRIFMGKMEREMKEEEVEVGKRAK
jgi:hypothetical protein